MPALLSMRWRRCWRLLDLTFADAEEEAAYNASMEHAHGKSCAFLGFFLGGCFALVAQLYHREWTAHGIHNLLITYSIVAAVVGVCVGVVGCLRLRGCVGVAGATSEYALLLMSFVMIVPFPIYNMSHAAQLIGQQSEADDLAGSDVLASLRMVVAVMGFALGPRVRTRLMHPMLLLALAVYIASMLNFESDLPRLKQRVILSSLVVFVTSIVLSWQQELLLRKMWSASKDLSSQQELKRVHQSAMELLSRFCDGVVRLSPQLHLLEHSSSLAALLLRQDSRCLKGISFLDCLAGQEDRGNVFAALHPEDDADQEEGHPVVLARLRDSHGTPFTVHIHHIRMSTPHGTEHLLGIVEAEPHVPPAPNAANHGSEDQVGELVNIADLTEARAAQRKRQGPALDLLNDDVASPASSASSSGTVLSADSAGSLASDSLQLDFFLAPGMPVKFVSETVRARFGDGVVHAGLTDVLEDVTSFEAWLDQRKAAMLSGSLQLPGAVDFGAVKVRRQGGSALQEMFLTVLFPRPSAQDMLELREHVEQGLYYVSARIQSRSSPQACKHFRRRGRVSARQNTRLETFRNFLGQPQPPKPMSQGGNEERGAQKLAL